MSDPSPVQICRLCWHSFSAGEPRVHASPKKPCAVCRKVTRDGIYIMDNTAHAWRIRRGQKGASDGSKSAS